MGEISEFQVVVTQGFRGRPLFSPSFDESCEELKTSRKGILTEYKSSIYVQELKITTSYALERQLRAKVPGP